METSPLICSANQWTGFYMITASVMKELNETPTPSKSMNMDILGGWYIKSTLYVRSSNTKASS